WLDRSIGSRRSRSHARSGPACMRMAARSICASPRADRSSGSSATSPQARAEYDVLWDQDIACGNPVSLLDPELLDDGRRRDAAGSCGWSRPLTKPLATTAPLRGAVIAHAPKPTKKMAMIFCFCSLVSKFYRRNLDGFHWRSKSLQLILPLVE